MDLHTKFDFPFVPILARDLYNEAKWQFVPLLDAIFVLQTLKVADIEAEITKIERLCDQNYFFFNRAFSFLVGTIFFKEFKIR